VPDPRFKSAPLDGGPISSEGVIVTDPVVDVPVILTVIPVSMDTAVRLPEEGVPMHESWAEVPAGGGVTGVHVAEPPVEVEVVDVEVLEVEVTLLLIEA
jgi:hypothetical protein